MNSIEGQIIEFSYAGRRLTAEVMLESSDGDVLLDFYDDDRPVLCHRDELLDLRVFDPLLVAV